MWLFQNKRKAVAKWHSKAMLIDPRKTKLTIFKLNDSMAADFAERPQTTESALAHQTSVFPYNLGVTSILPFH